MFLLAHEAAQIASVSSAPSTTSPATPTNFAPDDVVHLYLREGLERGDKLGFVETERQGFEVQRMYDWSELGEYNVTLHDFANGYLVRVMAGNHGVYLTTDELTIHQFEEVSNAIRQLLVEMEA